MQVRSLESGFEGSWHSGVITKNSGYSRSVEYDNMLVDNCSEKLSEDIDFPSKMESNCLKIRGTPTHNRGRIRPTPPPLQITKWTLHYGLCVDALHNDAWWEGVVFDHEDGTGKRLILFPDLGDEMSVGINNLRITQDWYEMSEEWKCRGDWLFLQLIERYEEKYPLLVSVRQLWYDVRTKEEFQKEICEWTFWEESAWAHLVLDTIVENMELTLDKVLDVTNLEETLKLAEVSSKRNNTWDTDFSLHRVVPEALEGEAEPALSLPEHPEFITLKRKNNASAFSVCEYGLSTETLPTNPYFAMVEPSEEGSVDAGNFIHQMEDDRFGVNLSVDMNGSFYREQITIQPRALSIESSLESTAQEGVVLSTTEDCGSKKGPCGQPNCKHTSLKLRRKAQRLPVPAKIHTSTLDLSSRRDVPMDLNSNFVVFEPEFCPQAVKSYSEISLAEEKQKFLRNIGISKDDLRLKARSHLSAIGWKFHYFTRKRIDGTLYREMRYKAPNGKWYYSLRTACMACVEEGEIFENISTTEQLTRNMGTTGNPMGSLALEKSSSPVIRMEFEDIVPPNGQLDSSGLLQSQNFVQCGETLDREIRNHWKMRENGSFHLESGLFQSRAKAGSHNRQCRKDGQEVSVLGKRKRGRPFFTQKLKKGNTSVIIRRGNNLDNGYPTRVLRSSKRARHVLVKSPPSHTPRTVLSWLIDNDVVLPRAKVQYMCRKDSCPKAEGRITRDGIKCSCCQRVFTLSGFETHAGSTYGHPATCILLEDGRSLLDCQTEMLKHNKMKSFLTEPRERIKSNRPCYVNDIICSVCHYGGTLILCDQCPSSFHLGCLGLEDLPEGKWYCPSCSCCICGQSEFNENVEQFTEKTVLYCDQCEREYHVGCLKKRRRVQLESCPKGNWFCSKKCEKIFVGLHKLLGKSVSLGMDNLTWTLLKATKDDSCSLNASDEEAMIECHSKLNVALAVMHECFEPIKESHSKRDLFEDVIFCKGSELNRLNFRGFYTVLLGRKDEVISAATFRVYGEKVAEVPLIGTRVQYRRLGMCRLLLNELEKKLMELGVERLLLPAVPQVLHAWTASFGFSKMADSERLKFLEYIFLDFPDTSMCQKLLATSTGDQNKLGRKLSQSDESIKVDKYGIVPGAIPADNVEQKQDVVAGNGNNERVLIETAPIPLITESINPESNQSHGETSGGCSVNKFTERKEDGGLHGSCLKYYTRRKI
ncbi:uncharacterized protein LOC122086021 isoform X2 [Macadamia integrifolia]|uniref:uncharacterized protein LOC122086021 isoform X2 n=1 Tax=Macadamia integrifolia TaxID=60698 RepID=UPI001C4FB25D|nr:uncharacterized protein LOC122086021 isoform X2 [Macadamia integrifolia]